LITKHHPQPSNLWGPYLDNNASEPCKLIYHSNRLIEPEGAPASDLWSDGFCCRGTSSNRLVCARAIPKDQWVLFVVCINRMSLISVLEVAQPILRWYTGVSTWYRTTWHRPISGCTFFVDIGLFWLEFESKIHPGAGPMFSCTCRTYIPIYTS
jgi:hypothetical protein